MHSARYTSKAACVLDNFRGGGSSRRSRDSRSFSSPYCHGTSKRVRLEDARLRSLGVLIANASNQVGEDFVGWDALAAALHLGQPALSLGTKRLLIAREGHESIMLDSQRVEPAAQ